MSRSNPYKLKPSRPKKTILAYGEGVTEKVFLDHIKVVYVKRNSGIAVKVSYGKGGTPECIMKKAIKLKESRGYDFGFVQIDADKKCSQKLEKEVELKSIEIIKSIPCIEGLLLSILESSFYKDSMNSKKCKHIFQKKYLRRKKRLDEEFCKKFLTKEKLEKGRKKSGELNRIIQIMTILK